MTGMILHNQGQEKKRIVHIPESHCETPVAIHLGGRCACGTAASGSEPPLYLQGLAQLA